MNQEIGEIKKITSKIEGWLTDKEGELLYNLAKNCKGHGVIIEIGSWKGKSTVWLGKGSQAGKNIKVYAIDPHTGELHHKRRYGDNIWTFDEFKDNIINSGVSDVIEPIVSTSKKAALMINEAVEFIFIDGDHSYELVKKDFECWFPKVIEGGIMAFHDTNGRYGPTRLVHEAVFKSKHFKNFNFVDSIMFVSKVNQNSFSDRIRNRFLLYKRKNIFFVKRILEWVNRRKKRFFEQNKKFHLRKKYCARREPFYKLAAEYLPENKASIVVDVGCGYAIFSKQFNLADKYKNLFLLDGNEQTVNNIDGLRLYNAPDRLPFDNGTVGFIHCSHLIEHFYPDELHKMLKEMDRVLEKDGIIAISAPLMSDKFYGNMTHIRPYSPKIIQEYLCYNKGNRTTADTSMDEISNQYAIKELVYRYGTCRLLEDFGSKYFMIDLGIKIIRKIISKLGFLNYKKNGYIIILKKSK